MAVRRGPARAEVPEIWVSCGQTAPPPPCRSESQLICGHFLGTPPKIITFIFGVRRALFGTLGHCQRAAAATVYSWAWRWMAEWCPILLWWVARGCVTSGGVRLDRRNEIWPTARFDSFTSWIFHVLVGTLFVLFFFGGFVPLNWWQIGIKRSSWNNIALWGVLPIRDF